MYVKYHFPTNTYAAGLVALSDTIDCISTDMIIMLVSVGWRYEFCMVYLLSLPPPPPPPPPFLLLHFSLTLLLFLSSLLLLVGEKPFETIEDLVQDGLITLHMEANNVEEYLRSARETRISHTTSLGGADQPNLEPLHETGPIDQPVFFEDETAEGTAKSSRDCMPRRPPYYPCTIPQRHSSINSPPLPEISKEESKRLLMKGYVPPPHSHSQHISHNGSVEIVSPVSR